MLLAGARILPMEALLQGGEGGGEPQPEVLGGEGRPVAKPAGRMGSPAAARGSWIRQECEGRGRVRVLGAVARGAGSGAWEAAGLCGGA